MNKLKFTKDEGTAFYKELTEEITGYFSRNELEKTGNNTKYIKIFLYFSLDVLFYVLMLTSTSLPAFFTYYFLMEP